MNCNECKSEMVNLFDKDVKKEEVTEVLNHIKKCPDCAEEYKHQQELITNLKPRVLPNAPFVLKHNIIEQLKMEENTMKKQEGKKLKISSLSWKLMSIAAVLAVVMMIIPIVDKNNLFKDNTAKAANVFIESSIQATQLVKSMIIKLKVRTLPQDNFSLIGTEYEMVNHTIYKSFEGLSPWRIDKGDRILVFDGKNQYLWLPTTMQGIKAGSKANFSEWFSMLLDPEKILMKEQNATTEDGSKITMETNNGEIKMSITSQAKGNFINDYCKNTSIVESDNRREYIFDKETNLLKSLKIFILDGKKETLILETEDIGYNIAIDPTLFTINLPSGISWTELNQNPKGENFKNISSKKAAELFFTAMETKDWKTVEEACPFFAGNTEKIKEIKEYFGGLKIVSIGESFKSGVYPGEFIPYEIKFKSGETKKHNLSLRNDNPSKAWIVDGGF